MKGFGKFIGGVIVGALAASAIPYSIKRDEETGALEIRSLLWAFRKTPGEEKDNIAFAIPPSGLDSMETPEEELPDEEEAFFDEEAAEAACEEDAEEQAE